ncbi:MAG: hypothetical protein VX527_08225 [Planctomycetota bacterium]|nr:hypothetical protein [Planctomycetota bacterium]
MTDSGDLANLIKAASASWDTIAAFAWRSYQLAGRGAVLVLAGDLRETAAEKAAPEPLPLNYFARDDVPSGDDFRSLMGTYDPHTQVMLMIGGLESGEQVFILESAEGQRVRPDSFA